MVQHPVHSDQLNLEITLTEIKLFSINCCSILMHAHHGQWMNFSFKQFLEPLKIYHWIPRTILSRLLFLWSPSLLHLICIVFWSVSLFLFFFFTLIAINNMSHTEDRTIPHQNSDSSMKQKLLFLYFTIVNTPEIW